MHFSLVSLFPEFFTSPMQQGLMGRAIEAGLVSYAVHNPRDFSTDKHHKVDDRPYGGGPGMVMLPQPLADVLLHLGHPVQEAGAPRPLPNPARPLVYLSPKGKPLTQALARKLTAAEEITLVCGRYEGIDARIEELFAVECISVGDFVLNGGEAAALCFMESVARLVPGYMGDEESGTEESFSSGLLEYPHYTKPAEFYGLGVPEVLRGGDHGKVARWRRERALETTLAGRPDIMGEAPLGAEDYAFLQEKPLQRIGKNLFCALVHYPVLDKWKNSVAVSLTNLDIHDISRSSCTFGLGGYYVVTPIQDQQRLLESLLRHWHEGAGKQSNPHRDEALSLVTGVASLEEAISDITCQCGAAPLVVGSSARAEAESQKAIGFLGVREVLKERPVLLLLGTGHGLAPEACGLCEKFLPPLRWHGRYNHLSVRAAAAIMMDRILGDWC